MKTCPKCNELNGDNNTECFKCNTTLPSEDYKKICPKCKTIYAHKTSNCDNCHIPLTRYEFSGNYNKVVSDFKKPIMFKIVSICVALAGVISGVICGKQFGEITPWITRFNWNIAVTIWISTLFLVLIYTGIHMILVKLNQILEIGYE